MQDFKQISVIEGPHHKVIVENPTDYQLIGLGDQGAVFLLSHDQCVKIYAKKINAKREAKAYRMCKGSGYFPKLIESGPDYNILEYINGVTLDDYIKAKGILPVFITAQLVSVIKVMKLSGFTRLDIPVRHILVAENECIKIIDLVNSYILNSDKPHLLFRFFKKSGLLEIFLSQVKMADEGLYAEWKAGMREYDP